MPSVVKIPRVEDLFWKQMLRVSVCIVESKAAIETDSIKVLSSER